MENNFFDGADVIKVYSLQNALDDGVILCLSTKKGHENDCRQFYKVPVYITENLYNKHVEAAKKLYPTNSIHDQEAVEKTVGWTIFDMLNMSRTLFTELSPQVRQFEYHLQATPDTFQDKTIKNIAVSGPGLAGEHIITFMLPEDQ